MTRTWTRLFRSGPWLLLLVLPALLATPALAACDDGDSEGPEVGITVDDIVEDEDEILGESVAVSDDVQEILSPRAFVYDGGLLVVMPEGLEGGAAITDGDVVRASGTVREFVLIDVEEDLGVELPEALFADFEHEPYIDADIVEVLDEQEGDGLFDETED